MTILFVFIALISAPFRISLPDTNDIPQDTPEEAVEEEEEDEDFEEIERLSISPKTGFNETLNDSLLRWEMLQSMSEWHFREPGRITYRLGMIGRHDAALINGHDPRHQRSFWETVPVEDRVTGMTNPNRLPHYRFATYKEDSRGIQYRNRYKMRRFYVNRPLTQVTLEQAGDEYRNIEGFITQNITQRLNLEAGYWGKHEEPGYPSNLLSGRKVSAGAYYHLNDRYILRGSMLYTGLQMDEPGGFVIDDMNLFPFEPLNTSANLLNARSSVRNTVMKGTLYHRENKYEEAHAQVTAYYDRNRRFFYTGEDSTFYRVNTTGISGRYNTDLFDELELDLEAYSEYSSVISETNRSMDKESWTRHEISQRASLPLSSAIKLDGWSEIRYRTDDFLDGQYGVGADLSLSRWFGIQAAFSAGEMMPSPQQLYWISQTADGADGNPELENEQIRRAELGATLFPKFRFQIDVGGQFKEISNPILIDPENEFQQTGDYESWSGYGKMGYYGDRFNSELALTTQFYNSDAPDPVIQQLSESGLRAWTQFSSYYENYVFDRAAYVKGGFIGWFSPMAYRTGTYRESMDYWDPNSFQQEIPEFARLDVEISARVRNVIVRLRYENVLDEVIQPGYFEKAHHPMMGRRFRLGLQWILRN